MIFKIGDDGRIDGLRAVGYHGRPGADQTPARRQLVLADDAGRLTSSVQVWSEDRVRAWFEGATLETVSWEHGTRLERPVRVRPDDFALVFGPEETSRAIAIDVQGVMSEHASNGLVVVCCRKDEADAVCARIANVARAGVRDICERGPSDELIRAAFWLSRAATTDDDVREAASALRASGYRHWEQVLVAGLRRKDR